VALFDSIHGCRTLQEEKSKTRVLIQSLGERPGMEFEWDPRKAAANARKHDVTFQDASTVFGDPLAITFEDPDHSVGEKRYITFGLSKQKRHVVVSHTERGAKIRIVSARLMTRKERNIYEEG
jgi:uncharacterized protein